MDSRRPGTSRSNTGLQPGPSTSKPPARRTDGKPTLSVSRNQTSRSHSPAASSYDGHSTTPTSPALSRSSRRNSNEFGHLPKPNSGNTSAAPSVSRFSTRASQMRSRSPSIAAAAAASATRTKYMYAAFFLVVSLISFVIQTELSAYIQHDLGWSKAYCMMYFTHGSWVVLWPAMIGIMRFQARDVPWSVFWRRHVQLLRSTALMVQTQRLDAKRTSIVKHGNPVKYMGRMTAAITCALTVAGLSWYIAVDMTTPADLTAIYNCNAFFAYAFSVPILHEKLRLDKSMAVLVAIVGVLVVAYGDGDDDKDSPEGARRFLGNIVIGIGSVLYGFYEVLYKRFACPPEGTSPYRGMVFATTFGSCMGAFTLAFLWVPLPLLHITGIEPFALPTGRAAILTVFSVLCNAIFSGSFLVLISLTSPVLSGVAALLTIFLVAIVDWIVKRKALGTAAIMGGLMIIVAFAVLSWSSYKEMMEHEAASRVATGRKSLDSPDFADSDADEEDAIINGAAGRHRNGDSDDDEERYNVFDYDRDGPGAANSRLLSGEAAASGHDDGLVDDDSDDDSDSSEEDVHDRSDHKWRTPAGS